MQTRTVDVLVIGGGAAGTAAAWQAARRGAKVLVAEPSPWLGGMITAAGVSAFDGNKAAMGSGLFRRLRDALEAHYGGADWVFTGWISETCFEPHVAMRLLHGFMAETNATVLHGAELDSMIVEGRRVLGARLRHGGATIEVRARVTIDATEYGDAIAAAGIPFSLGREARSETGETHAPEVADMEVQDLTMVATLKKYDGKAPALPRPANYDPAEFDCSTSIKCSTPDTKFLNHALHDWNSFISYAALPNDKYLLNWPFHANDSPDTIGVFGTPADRARALQSARDRTLRFVYYIQNDLGHPEWGLATDEYDTPDHLAYIPYMRESRRIYGLRKMLMDDVVAVPGQRRARFQPDAIGVGDYFLDHHHSKSHLPPGQRLVENYPASAPFQVPYGATVPRDWDGIMAAEKNISVSHIVNGCTRLQPCVMVVGQAVGMAAAMCVEKGIEPRELSVPELQRELIAAGLALYPTRDVHHNHPAFGAIQRLAMRGLVLTDDTFDLRPNEKISEADARRRATKWAEVTGQGVDAIMAAWQPGMTRGDFYRALDSQ
jgi:hypothetical protein